MKKRQFIFMALAVIVLVAVPDTLLAQRPDWREDMQTRALERLSGGLRIPTVGAADFTTVDLKPFTAFMNYLESVYPKVYETMEFKPVNTYGLVFHWKGSDRSRPPILFLSHYDVVPAPVAYVSHPESVFRPDDPWTEPVSETQTHWEYSPFSGAVANGRIYGRGALDMKGMLFAILEAADTLLAEGYVPDQDIWFAFGHDEENGGVQGAVEIASYFQAQGLTFDAVYDEGGFIGLEGALFEGLDKPVAAVGLGEKGFLNLRVNVRGMGGHSSMPPQKSSLVLASELVERLNANQLPARIIPPVASLLDRAGKMEGVDILHGALAEGDQSRLLALLERVPVTNALIRTTTAITMMHGSEAPNVLSPVAEIVVNFRLLPGDTIDGVIDHVSALCEGYDTEITVMGRGREPSTLSSENSRGFRAMEESLRDIYPDAHILPYITIGGTDAYKYQGVSGNIFRFMPLRLNLHEIGTIHNDNEYISIENYLNMIRYFRNLMTGYSKVE